MPLPMPDGPFHTISMDFILGLPESKSSQKYDLVLVVVDKYTKYGFFLACHTTITAVGVADLLWKNVTKHFGLPKVIVSNQDPHFLSPFGNLWQGITTCI